MKKILVLYLAALSTISLAVSSIAYAKDLKTDEGIINYAPKYSYKTLNTGIRMSYVEMGNKKGSPIVLVHGATDSYISFSQVGAYLGEKGYHVYIPELRGHGNTTKPTEGPYSINLLAKDINAWMKQVNIDQAHFVGHSLGSFVVQEMAISYPSRVKSLTLIGSSNKVMDNPTANWLMNGDAEFLGLLGMDGIIPDEFLQEWTYSTNYDPLFAEYTYKHAKQLPYYSWINTFSALSIDNTARLSSVTVPVLIIWGSDDVFFTINDQNALQESLGSDVILFRQKDGASHNTHWDGKMGNEIANDIDFFLTKDQNGNRQ